MADKAIRRDRSAIPPLGEDHPGQLHDVTRTERTERMHGARKGEDPDADAKAQFHAFEKVHGQLLSLVLKLLRATSFQRQVRQASLAALSIDRVKDALQVCLRAILVPQRLFRPTH